LGVFYTKLEDVKAPDLRILFPNPSQGLTTPGNVLSLSDQEKLRNKNI
jgi:hypothetical protein